MSRNSNSQFGSQSIAPTRSRRVGWEPNSNGDSIKSCLILARIRMRSDKTSLCSTLHENASHCTSIRLIIFSSPLLPAWGSPHTFEIEKVESYCVIIDHQVKRDLEFIDLFQDDKERDNMFHTGRSDRDVKAWVFNMTMQSNLSRFPVIREIFQKKIPLPHWS